MVQVMRAPAQSQVATPAPLSTTPAPAQSSLPVPVKRRVGRPSGYTEEIAKTICDALASGKSLRAVCAEPGMPDRSTVYDWTEKVEEFAARYARARILRAAHYADEIAEIADDAENRSSEGIQAARLQVDARKWLAARLDPHIWGDKTAVQHGGVIALEALVAGSLAAPAPDDAIEGEYVEKT